MNDTFNMFFFGERLTPLERICMQSFVKHGHRLHVYVYDEIALPAGVAAHDARRLVPRDELFLFDHSPSAFSNIFRYKLLPENGGWWVDTDVFCLSDAIPECEYAWAQQDPEQINGAILKFPKGDDLCARLLDGSIARASSLESWGELGPELLTDVLPRLAPEGHFGSREMFDPTHWVEAHMCWLEGRACFIEEKIEGAVFLHFWNSLLERMHINLSNRAPKGSFLESLVPESMIEAETDSALKEEILQRIRFILDYKPKFRVLYEQTMGTTGTGSTRAQSDPGCVASSSAT